MTPVPSRPTPLYGGGLSKPALRRAARLCDGWAGQIQSRAELPKLVAEVRRLRAEAGYRELAELGVTSLITVPWMFYGVSSKTGGLEEKCDAMRRFGEDVLHRFGYAAEDDDV